MGRPKKIKPEPTRKRIKKQQKLESLLEMVKNYKPPVQVEKSKKDANNRFHKIVEESGDCFRPDIYLESSRVCDDCPLVQYCTCRLKKFSKSYKK